MATQKNEQTLDEYFKLLNGTYNVASDNYLKPHSSLIFLIFLGFYFLTCLKSEPGNIDGEIVAMKVLRFHFRMTNCSQQCTRVKSTVWLGTKRPSKYRQINLTRHTLKSLLSLETYREILFTTETSPFTSPNAEFNSNSRHIYVRLSILLS